jgi:hypothetical protein
MANKKDAALMEQAGGFSRLAEVNMPEILAGELDGLDLGFEKIKIPSAGSTVFEVPGEDPGEPESAREFSAVILCHHPLFAYYKSKYAGASNPPDCGSFDGETGEGDPGGECRACPNNRFGSGENGAKACKNRRRIYLLREGEIFPLLLSLPTGSLKEFTRYLKRLLAKGQKSSGVVTRFSLRKATNQGGVTYSQAQFSIGRLLTDKERPLIEKLSEEVKAYSKSAAFGLDRAAEDSAPLDVDPETGEIIEPLA